VVVRKVEGGEREVRCGSSGVEIESERRLREGLFKK